MCVTCVCVCVHVAYCFVRYLILWFILLTELPLFVCEGAIVLTKPLVTYTQSQLIVPMRSSSPRVIIVPNNFTSDGVLFAFVAYFVTGANLPIRLTVWRPTSTVDTSFQLVCQHRVDVSALVASPGDTIGQFTRATASDNYY